MHVTTTHARCNTPSPEKRAERTRTLVSAESVDKVYDTWAQETRVTKVKNNLDWGAFPTFQTHYGPGGAGADPRSS